MHGAVLVTGGTGFIGGKLTTELLGQGRPVTVLGRACAPNSSRLRTSSNGLTVLFGRMEDHAFFQSAVAGTEVIFHKASSYGDMARNAAFELFQNDVEATKSLVETLKLPACTVKKVFFDSSIAVFGEGNYSCASCGIVRPLPRTAESVHRRGSFEPICPQCQGLITSCATPEAAALNGITSYARSKIMQEEMLRSVCAAKAIDLVIFRYATVYGPGQRKSGTCAKILHAVQEGLDIYLNEDGKQRRDFIFIDDVVRANIAAMNSHLKGCRIYNVGTEHESSLLDFVGCAERVIKGESRTKTSQVILSHCVSDGDVRSCRLTCDLIRNELGFSASFPLAEGLKQTRSYLEGASLA